MTAVLAVALHSVSSTTASRLLTPIRQLLFKNRRNCTYQLYKNGTVRSPNVNSVQREIVRSNTSACARPLPTCTPCSCWAWRTRNSTCERLTTNSTSAIFICNNIRSISVGVALGKKAEWVTVHFINRDGEKISVKARTGQNILDVVVDNDIDIDGYGCCEGTLSCSTCHLIFSEEMFDKMKKPSSEELDMLDLAYGLTDTSRLGCQVILTKEMDGATFIVPDSVSDARDV